MIYAGGFGGVFDIKQLNYTDPLLIAGTDGVGTKLEIAKLAKNHTTIGIDLVAMSINDILVQGAEPLFFLDYYSTSKLYVDIATDVIRGISHGCIESGCALIGGETAEMPGLYQSDDYDLAGFGIGIVERNKLLPKINQIKSGNILIGLCSSGIHSNGYSLVRKIIKSQNLDINAVYPQLSTTDKLIDVLLTPTRLYVKSLLSILQTDDSHNGILGLAHITGGGLTENIPRVLPSNMQARLDCAAWSSLCPPIFPFIQSFGVPMNEMTRTYNCGIGMVVVVEHDQANHIIELLKQNGESNPVIIGELHDKSDFTQPSVVINNLEQLFTE